MKAKNKIAIMTVLLAATISIVFACKDPVYVYALANWSQRSYYHIFRVYDSTKQHEELPAELKSIISHEDFYGNYGLISADINADLDKEFGQGFKEFIIEHTKGKELPTYVMVSPMQYQIYQGQITTEEFKTLGASPKTIEIAQKLSRGEIVFIYVAPVDQARAAEKKKILDSALLQFIEVEKQVQLESGELPPETELKDVKAAKVSYVEISSVDPKEKFLYRTLIGLNPNTKDDGKEKLFGTVGRGFTFDTALTDKTFDEEQIVSFGLFLSGPCSCTVKSGNPGSDIISNWDWDSNIKNPLLKNDEPAEIDGFGGKEIESVDDASRSTKNNKSSANISPTGEQVADGNDLIKIILFGFSGLGVLLLIVTKFMKSNETK